MFKLTFDFNDREATDVAYLNNALAGMSFSNLSLEESDGYLSTTKTMNIDTDELISISYNYGFDHIVFGCETESNKTMHTYQIDVKAFAKDVFADSEAFDKYWTSLHPDRQMRIMQMISYHNANAFVVIHHEKNSSDCDSKC